MHKSAFDMDEQPPIKKNWKKSASLIAKIIPALIMKWRSPPTIHSQNGDCHLSLWIFQEGRRKDVCCLNLVYWWKMIQKAAALKGMEESLSLMKLLPKTKKMKVGSFWISAFCVDDVQTRMFKINRIHTTIHPYTRTHLHTCRGRHVAKFTLAHIQYTDIRQIHIIQTNAEYC